MDNEITNVYLNVPNEANLQLADPGLLGYYKDIADRIYWLTGEINQENYDLIQYILQMNRADAANNIPPQERKPIRIMFNSEGGELDVADAICSTIELSETPIYGYGIGLVASAASLIFLSCHKRYALKTAYWILHKGSAQMTGDYNRIASAMEDYQKQIERLVKFYEEKTTLPHELIDEKIKTDWYIHAPEAEQYHIVDGIIDNINQLF